MFDFAFSELVVVGVVALVVLGPERLPKVARTAGHLFGRLQRYVATVKADLNREIDMSELSKVKQEVQEAARAFEQSAQEHAKTVEAEARAVSASLEPPATDTPVIAAPPTQSELLATQEQGLTGDVAAAAPSSPVPRVRQSSVWATVPVAEPEKHGMLDLGIEPARRSHS
jgi:sec-independent protein translocase protein TatB